jgi:heterodisulfide reductase subunit A-like polyferredoxin
MGAICASIISAHNPRNPQTIGSEVLFLPSAAAKAEIAVAARRTKLDIILVRIDDMVCTPCRVESCLFPVVF